MIAHYCVGSDLIDRLWEKVKGSGGIYRSMDGSSYEKFQLFMIASDVVYEFSFGALRVDGIYTKSAKVHGIFWSKDVFRNIGLMVYTLDRMGRLFGVREVFCEFPASAKSIRRLLERGGFARHGTGSFSIDSEYVPTDIYVLQLW